MYVVGQQNDKAVLPIKNCIKAAKITIKAYLPTLYIKRVFKKDAYGFLYHFRREYFRTKGQFFFPILSIKKSFSM